MAVGRTLQRGSEGKQAINPFCICQNRPRFVELVADVLTRSRDPDPSRLSTEFQSEELTNLEMLLVKRNLDPESGHWFIDKSHGQGLSRGVAVIGQFSNRRQINMKELRNIRTSHSLYFLIHDQRGRSHGVAISKKVR